MLGKQLLAPQYTNTIGTFIVTYPLVGWLLYLGAIYLQLFAVVAAFRPALHRVWGMVLIGFHLMSALTFAIGFPRNVLLLALFLVGSPFVEGKPSWRTVLTQLPVIGWGVQRLLAFHG